MEQRNTFYCEDCMEEVAADDVFWEGEHAYCGRCGSELELSSDEDLVDTIRSRRITRGPNIGEDVDVEDEEEWEDEDSGFSYR